METEIVDGREQFLGNLADFVSCGIEMHRQLTELILAVAVHALTEISVAETFRNDCQLGDRFQNRAGDEFTHQDAGKNHNNGNYGHHGQSTAEYPVYRGHGYRLG